MIRRACRSALMLSMALAASCGDTGTGITPVPPAPPTTPPPAPPAARPVNGPGPFVVSDPALRTYVISGGSPVAIADQVWIGLPEGSLLDFTAVTILVQRTGAEIVTPLRNGGFDALAIQALAGDTLVLTVSGGVRQPPAARVVVVPTGVPPKIIRTVPPRGTRDVALNSRMQVYFSEPVDESILAPGVVMLENAGTPVSGKVQFVNNDRTSVEFAPTLPLAPGTAYRMVISKLVRDLEGSTLNEEGAVQFTTAGTPFVPPPVPPFEGTAIGEFAFMRNRQIYRSTAQGVVQLTHTLSNVRNMSPAWSPDGSRIAFSSDRDGMTSIYVMNADGSNVTRLTSGTMSSNPAWSPDGQSLVYEAWHDGSQTSIERVSIAGGTVTTLVPPSDGVWSPSFSPDGSSILLSISRTSPDGSWWGWAFDLFVMPLDPGTPMRLVRAGPPSAPYIHVLDGALSADGQWIAMTECQDDFVLCSQAPTRLSVVRFDGSGYRTLASPGSTSAAPTWSPDGTRIAFTKASCGQAYPCIAVVPLAGGTEEIILTNASEPSWRP